MIETVFGKLGPVWKELSDSGLISSDPSDIEIFHKGVRDNPAVDVLKCKVTDVIFLNAVKPSGKSYDFRKHAIDNAFLEDNARRAMLIEKSINNKTWADIGSGSGGIIERLHRNASLVTAVEPDINAEVRKLSTVETCNSIDELPDATYDIVTMFHVLEHIVPQKAFIEKAKRKIGRSFGKLIIEVPHARDILIGASPLFRKHTFWSEHYVLHTRQSLTKLLTSAGFKEIELFNVQRYGLSNHIQWMNKAADNREASIMAKIMESEDMKEADKAYREKLIELGLTDTILGVCYA
jgi:2-polyprenyl-3-methyl-5-hydroxy-6-metoxy-1,4-benzoquinol methylase